MPALDFPNSPTTGTIFDEWQWDGTKWVSTASGGPFMPLKGVTDGSNAAAGQVGEYLSTIVPSTSLVSLPSGENYTQIAALSLTAGDWDVWGEAYFGLSSVASIVTGMVASSSTAVNPGNGSGIGQMVNPASGGAGTLIVPIAPARVNLTATTNYYLYGASTAAASGYGKICARRVR